MSIALPPIPPVTSLVDERSATTTTQQHHSRTSPPVAAQRLHPPPTAGLHGPFELPTPPDSAASYGMNGYANGMGGRPPPGAYGNAGVPSPPGSSRGGRMSNGTQMSQGDAAQRRKQSAIEDGLAQHYGVLKRFLAQEETPPESGRTNRARDKLVRLSPVQFQELSTDVYDELLRRQAQSRGGNAHSALPPRDNFHPKRNQARQKLSVLSRERFGALAADVFFELERRVPRFAGSGMDRGMSPRLAPPGRAGSPSMNRRPGQGSFGGSAMTSRGMPMGGAATMGMQPKSSQSNTAVPNKSYLVEEDDGDVDSVYGNRRDTSQTSKSNGASDKMIGEYQGQIDELQEKLSQLEGQLQDKNRELQDTSRQMQEKDGEIDRLEERNRSSARNNDKAEQEWENLRTQLEGKVTDAQALNKNLQTELDRIKAQHQDREEDLRSQLDVVSRKNTDGGEWRTRFNEMQLEQTNLKREKDELQEQLRKQQGSTNSVRREMEGFLAEVKELGDRSDRSLQREERLMQQVQGLEAELRTWRNRCAKMKTQLGQADTVALVQPDVVKEAFVRPDGLIQYVHVTSFQLAIDETLRTARARDNAALLDTLRTAVEAVSNICGDVPSSAPTQAVQQRNKVSAMANNLITATKNFAAAKGLSPVSLVDAAAANLSTAVVDLVHLVKMQPSPDRADLDLDGVPEEIIDDTPEMMLPEPEKPRQYFSNASRGSLSESVYSTTTGPRASTRLQTLPNSTYSASIQPPQPPASQSQVNGIASHRQQPSYASQTSQSSQLDKSQHRQQASYASQASSIIPSRPSISSQNGGITGMAQHRQQASFASQSSYNSQPPAALHSRAPGGSTGRSSFDRFGTASPQGGGPSLTGPGSGPGPLSPIPSTPTGRGLQLAPQAAALRSPPPAASPALLTPGGPASDPAATELAAALDDESAAIIDSIQSLVTSIRTAQPPDLVRARAATVASILARIITAAQSALQKSTNLQNSPVARIVENLAMAQRRLGAADENAGSVIDRGEEKGDAWREVVRVFPPVAFEVAREVRELGAKVKELGRGGAGDESEDDFR